MQTKRLESRVADIAQSVINDYLELFSLILAEKEIAQDEQMLRLNKVAQVILMPILKETIFKKGRRVALDFDGDVLELNIELLSRISDEDLFQALADPIAQTLQVSQLNIALLFQSDERFRKNLASRLKRSQKNFVRATSIGSFVTSRIQVFQKRINQIADFLTTEGEKLVLTPPDFSAASWPDWEGIQDRPFVESVEEWVNARLFDTDFNEVGTLLPKLTWDSLSLTKQSQLKNVGQELRALSLDADISEKCLSAFAETLFADGEELCLRRWPAFGGVVLAFSNMVQRERQLFGVAWASDIGKLKVTKPAGELFGLSLPQELPWSSPVVCWSQREITALRDLLIGIDKTLPSHVLIPFREEEATNEILKIPGNLPAVGIKLSTRQSPAPSYDHHLTSSALSAARNLIVSKFFELDEDEKLSTTLSMRETLENQYPRAEMIWERRFHNHSKLGLEEKFVDLVDAFRPLMDLPVLFDPFRSPDLNQIVKPSPVFIIGVREKPFQFSFRVPIPAVSATLNHNALRVRVVRVSAEQKCEWWGDRSIHISKLQSQNISTIMDAILGGLTFILSA